MAAPPLRPDGGFCLQTESTGTPAARWYVNMCKHRLIDMPLAYSGKVVDREYILRFGLANLQVPFDLGSFRKLKARADGAKQTTYCIDAVFNPLIVQLFMEDAFCQQLEKFRPFVVGLVLKRIEESVGVKLAAQQVKLVKSLRYKDGEEGGTMPREFTELPGGDLDSFDPEAPAQSAASAAERPLIEDVTPGRKPTAIKKGFLNSKDANLYGPEGSKEGVLPENAGEPMGWMPKKLRQTCKIVDCNAPEYQEHEKKRRAAEDHNEMVGEFRDGLLKDMEKWTKKLQPDHWQDDRPDSAEPPPSVGKYDVDYSRFDKIVDDEEKPKDERDWYYDSDGKPQPIVKRPPPQAVSEPEAEPGLHLKKGFLESSSKPLYPRGSEQGRAPPSEELTKGLASLLRPLTDMEADGASAEKRSGGPAGSTAVKVPQRPAPKFQLGELPDAAGLQLVVEVPGLESMTGVDLNVTERSASLVFPAAAKFRPLEVELPHAVMPAAARAKFSRKTQQITVRLPSTVPGD